MTQSTVRLPVLETLSVSELTCHQSCKRKRYLRYVLGRRRKDTSAGRKFGTLFHRGLNAWWSAPVDPYKAAIEAMRAIESDTVASVIAEELMLQYDTKWKDEPYEVHAVEPVFRCPLVNPETGAASRTFEEVGALDVIVRDLRDEKFKFIEHKTSADDISPGSNYWRRLAIDNQVSTYFVGGRSLGFPIEECIYDVIGKPRHRPLLATPDELRKYTKATKTEPSRLYANQRDTDETLDDFRLRVRAELIDKRDQYLVRGTVLRLETEEREAALDNWLVAKDIRDCDRMGHYPRSHRSCTEWGQECDYFDVCTGAASIEDENLFRTATSKHEELER